MHWERDGMTVVRSELCDRLDGLQRAARRMSVRDFVQHIASVRTMAAAHGMVPVVCLADALERAVRANPRGCPADIYFDRLRDAVGCGPTGSAAASKKMLASISVRLSA